MKPAAAGRPTLHARPARAHRAPWDRGPCRRRRRPRPWRPCRAPWLADISARSCSGGRRPQHAVLLLAPRIALGSCELPPTGGHLAAEHLRQRAVHVAAEHGLDGRSCATAAAHKGTCRRPALRGRGRRLPCRPAASDVGDGRVGRHHDLAVHRRRQPAAEDLPAQLLALRAEQVVGEDELHSWASTKAGGVGRGAADLQLRASRRCARKPRPMIGFQ
jgi:hypothetical protein